jgi:hypothetical protein
MCVPALGLIVSAASAMASFAGQQAEHAAAKKRYAANAENARTATINQYAALQLKAQQEGAKKHQAEFTNKISDAQALATLNVAADEGGVGFGSGSAQQLMRANAAGFGRERNVLQRNLGMTMAYLSNEGEATQNKGQGQINSVANPIAPSPFAAIAGFASSAYSMRT